MKAQMLLCVYRITERTPEGHTVATEHDHDEWWDITHAPAPTSVEGEPDFVLTPPSNAFASVYKTVRSVPDSTPNRDTNNTKIRLQA